MENQNLVINNKQRNYPKNNTKEISPSKDRLSPQLKPQLQSNNNKNNNNIKNDVTRASLNKNAKDPLLPFREQLNNNNARIKKSSKPSDKIPSHDRNIRKSSIDRNSNAANSRLSLQQTSRRNKSPTNIQLNMKTFDIAKNIEVLSLSRNQSPVSDMKNITEVQTNKIDYINYPASIDQKKLNVNGEYSRSNLINNYSQIDNQCENCQNLISQNDNVRSEINKNESEIVKLENSNNENVQSKFDDLDNENMKLQISKFGSEIENNELDHRNNYLKDEKLDKENHSLNGKNVNIELENLRSQISEYEREIKKMKSEIEHLKSNNATIKSVVDKFETETESMKAEIIKSDQQNKDLRKEIDKLSKQVKDFESSSKFEPKINHNKENSKRIDGNKIVLTNQEINSSDVVSNSNQSTPAIKKSLSLNSKPTKFQIKTGNSSIKLTNIVIKNLQEPIGFENPKGYCFLNCVVQQFYSCVDFRNELIKFHATSQIAASNADKKNIFISNFCKLMDEINKRNVVKIKEIVMNIQEFFESSSFGDDVHKCFMNILTVVSNLTKKQNSKKSASTPITPQHSFEMYRNQHEGIVFDLFYGQMAIKLVCSKCAFEFNKRFQLFKSIPLPVPKSTEMIPLENVIKNYLKASPVDTDDMMNCQCPGGSKNLYSITEFTHMPSYLFIYLNRGSYFENGEKNNTFINCNEILTFPTGKSSTKYRLISIIDHIGDNYGGHYYAKSCFESDQWWILNDSFVNLIEDKKSIVTEQAIVFLFKKISH